MCGYYSRAGTNHAGTVIPEKTCDGIFHCLYGEDERFEHCKDTFPKEATIECIEKRLPGTIEVTIMAIPCDGILECRDGRDENCEDDKMILVISVALLCLTTVCIYLYLVLIRLPIWKDSVFKNFDTGNIDLEPRPFICSNVKGNKLAKLKVSTTGHISQSYNKMFVYSPFRMMRHKSNVLRHWVWK